MRHSYRTVYPPEDLLGMVHYNPEIMEADREGSSPYDYSAAAVEEIRKSKNQKVDKSTCLAWKSVIEEKSHDIIRESIWRK